MAQNEWHYTDSNTVYQPNQWLWPLSNIQMQIPLDIPLSYHSFKLGVDYRYWNGYQWVERNGIEWAQPSGPSLDQVLINYPPQRNFKVFICHSEKDSELTQIVSDYVTRCGQIPYVAESLQHPDLGKKLWEDKIDKALQTSNALLVLWTRNSAPSVAVTYEIQKAKLWGKRIIPAIESGLEPPQLLHDLVYVKFDYSNHTDAIKAILTSLLDYEKEVSQQQGGGIMAFLALLAILGATRRP